MKQTMLDALKKMKKDVQAQMETVPTAEVEGRVKIDTINETAMQNKHSKGYRM